jgi:type IV secretory pathway VirB2 component (pilin)
MGDHVSETLHPNAPHHLPGFITAPGDTDTLMVVVGIVLIGSVMMVGNLYLRLHSMPERMAHKSQKLQFEIVAVLGLIALFTHNHLFWVIGLLLAMVDLPDFGTPLRSIAGSVQKIADGDATNETVERSAEAPSRPTTAEASGHSGEGGGQGHA